MARIQTVQLIKYIYSKTWVTRYIYILLVNYPILETNAKWIKWIVWLAGWGSHHGTQQATMAEASAAPHGAAHVHDQIRHKE